ncbi:MAG TPA: DNA polymerase Y family protein, partial [Methylibium sp.]|uniref:DNA polymerase Y family protein n=1 Tax=Methylibium sp. TaxID=2067992 RepID=UPI002DBD4F79
LSVLSPTQWQALQALGLRRLRDLRGLPRAGVQRRFGRELPGALDRAYGDAPDPRAWLPVPERFALRCELMQRADDAASLNTAVQALLPALIGWLQLRWEAASVLALRLRHEHGRAPLPDTRLLLRLSIPSRDADQLALLWRERLARLTLAAPVYEIALELDASVPHGGRPGELLPVAGGDAIDHAALLDRLTARLGAERVLRCEPQADHRPERAQRMTAAIAAVEAKPPMPRSTAQRLARPAWLLDPPESLACDTHDRPLHGGGPLQLRSRPERIEAGWFDGALVCRDYHVAEGRDHRLRWIYRERRLEADERGARWFLHGWFG